MLVERLRKTRPDQDNNRTLLHKSFHFNPISARIEGRRAFSAPYGATQMVLFAGQDGTDGTVGLESAPLAIPDGERSDCEGNDQNMKGCFHSRLAAAALVLLAPAVAGAEEAPEDQPLLTAADFVCCGSMAAVILVVLGVLAWKFWQSYGSMDELASVSESAFERSVLREFEGANAPDAAPDPTQSAGSDDPAAPRAEISPAAAAPPDSPPPGEGVGRGEAVGRFTTDPDVLVQRLQQLTVFGDREGTFTLPCPPHGQVYRLRTGGTAVVLPRMESEATMNHLVRRFDVVIVMCADGEHIVMGRLQSRLRSLMERPSDFEGPPLA